MAGQAPPPPQEGLGDDFLEQILAMPSSYGTGDEAMLADSMALQRISADGDGMAFHLGLSLEQGSSCGKRLCEGIDAKAERESMQLARLLPPGFMQHHTHQIQSTPPQIFHGQVKQGGVTAMPQPPAPRPKVLARRGQATDPHSIAERVKLQERT
ncbi:hypothetical protein ZIOFF_051571 [Zingiber officinale]|uniref:Uncharacterized protein n=1 Tax=Zingiber officinale TaxID=94328 RepID=A0A8J5FKR3_ZINOF|nr:hypothetical protein ZIOFF_051571 [Zingiber officinale]